MRNPTGVTVETKDGLLWKVYTTYTGHLQFEFREDEIMIMFSQDESMYMHFDCELIKLSSVKKLNYKRIRFDPYRDLQVVLEYLKMEDLVVPVDIVYDMSEDTINDLCKAVSKKLKNLSKELLSLKLTAS